MTEVRLSAEFCTIQKNRENIIEWILDNIPINHWECFGGTARTYIFRYEADAIAFKLKFGI